MSAVGIIPARYASSRFPGKPLAPIAGLTMIERVWRGACDAKLLREVFVATDDDRIARACEQFGAPVLMTSASHPTGTDRIAEAALTLSDDIVVNIQGDEPLIRGFVIDAVVETLRENETDGMATLVHAADCDEVNNPNRVKVAIDRSGHAKEFSRTPIARASQPYESRPGSALAPARYWQHIGIYGFRREFLLQFVDLPRTAGEKRRGLEQLRALEHGFPIRTASIEGWSSVAVDVPEDVAVVERLLKLRNLGEAAKQRATRPSLAQDQAQAR